MSKLDHFEMDGVVYLAEAIEINGRCQPILDWQKTEQTGYMCYRPGPVTIDVRIFATGDIPAQMTEERELRFLVGTDAYVGKFSCVQRKKIGEMLSLSFHRDGAAERVST